MVLEIDITNADSSVALAEISTYSLDLYTDKPNSARLKIGKRHSVSQDAAIEMIYKGKTIFRGFLETPSPDKSDQIELQFADVVQLLEYRIAQAYTYPKGTTLDAILGSSAPSAGGVAGLLYLANSLVPQGWFREYLGAASELVYKCQGYGTTKYPAVTNCYEAGVQLTKAASLGAMVAGTWFQSAEYLYIWCLSGDPLTDEIKADTTKVPGTWYPTGSGTGVYVLYGGGKDSQFGTIADIYKDATKLTISATFGGMGDNTFYQDDYNLFVKIPIAETLTDYPVTIPNFKDTDIVFGDTFIAGWTLDTDFVLTKASILTNIKNLFSHIDAEYEFIYAVAGVTRFNVVDLHGRGTEEEPTHTWRIEELKDFRTTYNKEALANCLVAIGSGTPTIHAAGGSLDPRAVWREAAQSYQNDDIYTLRETVTRQMAYYEDPRSYSFKTYAIFGLQGGDMVKILRNKQKMPPIYSRIQKVSYTETNDMDVTLGHRNREIADIWGLVKPGG